MRRLFTASLSVTVLAALAAPIAARLPAQSADPRLDALKAEVSRDIDSRAKQIQEMVDQVFSYGELGMQEFETSTFLTGILEKNGFTVQRGVAGIPVPAERFAAEASVGENPHPRFER